MWRTKLKKWQTNYITKMSFEWSYSARKLNFTGPKLLIDPAVNLWWLGLAPLQPVHIHQRHSTGRHLDQRILLTILFYLSKYFFWKYFYIKLADTLISEYLFLSNTFYGNIFATEWQTHFISEYLLNTFCRHIPKYFWKILQDCHGLVKLYKLASLQFGYFCLPGLQSGPSGPDQS